MVPVLAPLISLLASALVLLPTSVPGPLAPVARRSCSNPAQVLNLTNWKLTLPSGSPGSPTEVAQPQLASYRNAQYFYANSNCDGANFVAPVNGITTSGSKYPRSELREMTNNGQSTASWTSATGTHRITVSEAFARLPAVKPQLVGVQIHDALDDISTFRLEGTKLWITNGDNPNFYLASGNYRLGTRFTAGYEVVRGQVKAYYNGRNVVTFPATFSGAYFKAGAYTQANCVNSTPCDATNYGATTIYSVSVTHLSTPAASRIPANTVPGRTTAVPSTAPSSTSTVPSTTSSVPSRTGTAPDATSTAPKPGAVSSPTSTTSSKPPA